MVTNEIKFDPTSPQERSRVIEYLIQLCKDDVERTLSRVCGMRSPQVSSTYSHQQFLDKINELNGTVRILEEQKKTLEDKITDMNSDLERYQKVVSKHDSKIESKDTEIAKLKEQVDKLQQHLQKTEQDAKQAAKEADDKLTEEQIKYESELEKKENQIQQLESDRIKETRKLGKEIERLQTQLQEFVPNIGGVLGEEQGYQLDEAAQSPTLTQTMDYSAPYIVVISDNGKARFHFNIEKGPATEAIAKRNSMLAPFCEIIEEMDNANSIQLAGEGIATISSMGDLRSSDVITKAKIRLVRI